MAIGILAAFVRGAFGFGFPLLSPPLLVLAFDLRTAVLLTLLPTVNINLVSILSEHHWRPALRSYWPIPAFTMIGSILGTQVLLGVDPESFRLLPAAVLIAYLVSDHLHRSERVIEVPKWDMALFGLPLGLLAGVVNIFAPLVVAYALYTRMPGALWLGIRVRRRVDVQTYRGMLRGALWVISIAILLGALRRMLWT